MPFRLSDRQVAREHVRAGGESGEGPRGAGGALSPALSPGPPPHRLALGGDLLGSSLLAVECLGLHAGPIKPLKPLKGPWGPPLPKASDDSAARTLPDPAKVLYYVCKQGGVVVVRR